MANQIVFIIAEMHGLRIYVIMLPSSDFSVAHCWSTFLYHLPGLLRRPECEHFPANDCIRIT